MTAAADAILASDLWRSSSATTSVHSVDTWSKIRTGQLSIDEVLDRGLSYGAINCISAERDHGNREIARALLINHLLDSRESTAIYIDTSQALDLRKLYGEIAATWSSRNAQDDDAAAAEQQAYAALDRLQIMKVFDLIGLTESISEAWDIVSKYDLNKTRCLLVVDNITQVAGPLLKTNLAQSNALVVSVMRSLAQLARSLAVCVVILNTAYSHGNPREQSPSCFQSCTTRPSLGKTFAYMVDLHLMIHKVVRTSRKTGQGDRSVIAAVPELVHILEVVQDRYGTSLGRWAPITITSNDKIAGLDSA